MNNTRFVTLLLLSSFFFLNNSFAQLNLPEPSPACQLKQKVGFTTITVNFSRPSCKGRKVFGGLVPYNEMWRTGASDATTIKFSDDVLIEGKKLSKGTYSVYSIPGPKDWTIIINKDTTLHGTSGYSESLDALRFSVPQTTTDKFFETFNLSILDIINGKAVLVLNWEKTEVKINLDTESDKRVVDEIEKRIVTNKENNPDLLYQSSLYYLDNNKDLKTAENYVNQALKLDQSPKLYLLKAKINKKQGKTADAMDNAKKSLELAKEKNLKNYIKMCEDFMKDEKL